MAIDNYGEDHQIVIKERLETEEALNKVDAKLEKIDNAKETPAGKKISVAATAALTPLVDAGVGYGVYEALKKVLPKEPSAIFAGIAMVVVLSGGAGLIYLLKNSSEHLRKSLNKKREKLLKELQEYQDEEDELNNQFDEQYENYDLNDSFEQQ